MRIGTYLEPNTARETTTMEKSVDCTNENSSRLTTMKNIVGNVNESTRVGMQIKRILLIVWGQNSGEIPD